MEDELTNRQRQVLDAIVDAMQTFGRSPSIVELQKEFGLSSTTGILKHLNALEAKGYITRMPGARGIVVNQEADCGSDERKEDFIEQLGLRSVSLLGNIAAGGPIFAQENVEQTYCLPQELSGNGESFLLRVRGDSMIDEGILPGDVVVLESCERVMDGEIAAVLIEDEATLKRFFRRGKKVFLESANENYLPIEVDLNSDYCKIIGRLVGLMRSYTTRL